MERRPPAPAAELGAPAGVYAALAVSAFAATAVLTFGVLRAPLQRPLFGLKRR
jgi:hypothetical protein